MWNFGRVWPALYSEDRTYGADRLDGAALCYEKGLGWAYEKEFRVIRPLEQAATVLDGKIHLFDISPSTITGVILGSRMESGCADKLVQLAEGDPRYSHLNVERLVVDENGELRHETVRAGKRR
jgi:hypothetical protein